MAVKFTDKQRKLIIGEYVNGSTYSELARKYNVNKSTIMRLCNKDATTQQRATAKKEENTKDMLEWLDSQKSRMQNVISMMLDGMTKEKIEKASLRDVVISYGIMVDKGILDQLNGNNVDREIRVVFDDKDRTKPKD